MLTPLQDAGPAALPADVAMPYLPAHVLRRKDLVELFDTTPDLAGFDLDASRFIREADDLDVQVFWRDIPAGEGPNPDQPSGTAPRREELCPVPVYVFREFARKRRAFRWDVLERQWGPASPSTILPGQIFLAPADQGGYIALTGWDAESAVPVTAVPCQTDRASEANDGDWLSQRGWQRIAGHADEVTAEVTRIIDAVGVPEVLATPTKTAGRWHDRGKAHAVFRDAIPDGPAGEQERPEAWRGCRDLAEAPKQFWRGYSRKHFRHELATGLAMLQAGLPDLVVYLATAHHGKVRLSIRSLPSEEGRAAARSHDSRRDRRRFMARFDEAAATTLGELSRHVGTSAAATMRQLIMPATPEDIPPSWPIAVHEQQAKKGRQRHVYGPDRQDAG